MRSIHLSPILLVSLACSLEAPTVPASELPPDGSETTVSEGNGSGTGTDDGPSAAGDGTDSAGGDDMGAANGGSEAPDPELPLAGGNTTPVAGDGSGAADPAAPGNTPEEGGAGSEMGDPGMGEGMPDGTDPMGMGPTPPSPEELAAIAAPLDGMRIDDPCTGAPSSAAGATCNHVVNPFHQTRDVDLVGVAGTTYDVTLRVRGVVEPTRITGGTRPDTTTVNLGGRMYRAVPLTIGGSPGDATYQPWRLSISNPARDYYLNDYQLTEHTIFSIDYEITIEMDGNANVELDVADGNDRQIDNYARYSHEGLAGSTNLGQFVQLTVVSVTPR